MAKLSTLIIPSVLAALAATASPAAAAPVLYHHAGYSAAQTRNLQKDINQLDARIDKARSTRRISAREATGLRRDVVTIRRQFALSQRGGLSTGEARSIAYRIDRVNNALRGERRDFDRRRG